MLRNILAMLVGLVMGMSWNMGFIFLNSYVLFPMGDGVDMQDPSQMKAYVATLPARAFLVVLVAHVGQAGVGGWISARMAHSHPAVLAWIIGILTAVGSAYNQVTLEGPSWMWIDVLLAIIVTWFIATSETKRRAKSA